MQLHRLQQSESDIKMQLLAEQRQQRLSYDHQQAMQQFDDLSWVADSLCAPHLSMRFWDGRWSFGLLHVCEMLQRGAGGHQRRPAFVPPVAASLTACPQGLDGRCRIDVSGSNGHRHGERGNRGERGDRGKRGKKGKRGKRQERQERQEGKRARRARGASARQQQRTPAGMRRRSIRRHGHGPWRGSTQATVVCWVLVLVGPCRAHGRAPRPCASRMFVGRLCLKKMCCHEGCGVLLLFLPLVAFTLTLSSYLTRGPSRATTGPRTRGDRRDMKRDMRGVRCYVIIELYSSEHARLVSVHVARLLKC